MSSEWKFSLGDILDRLQADPNGPRAAYWLRRGTMRVGVYAPKELDRQEPHRQDELYIIISGTGDFVKDDERRSFAPNDAIFVEAGVPHRFENFTEDFATWVVFWGPDGGEK